MEEKSKGRRWLSNLLKIAFLAGIMYLVLHKHYKSIWENIRALEPFALGLILLLGLIYFFLDAAACRQVLSSRLEGFSYGSALDITFLGIFCQVTTFSAGIMPAQSLYLYRRGLDVGDSIGLLMLKFTIHKAAILTFSGILLIFAAPEVLAGREDLITLARIGWFVGFIILLSILTVCSRKSIRDFIIRLVYLLPDKGKWPARREKIIKNIGLLYNGIKTLAAKPQKLILAYVFNILKFLVFYSVPYAALRAVGAGELSFFRAFSLAGLCHVIATALPNVAGMGPIEAAYMLLFSIFLSGELCSSTLVLFRLSTYFFPFLLSAVLVLLMQKKLLKH